jgi:hypothetical protein
MITVDGENHHALHRGGLNSLNRIQMPKLFSNMQHCHCLGKPDQEEQRHLYCRHEFDEYILVVGAEVTRAYHIT